MQYNPKNRYITLTGDPIRTHPLKALLTSKDVAATGLATAFTAAAESLPSDATFGSALYLTLVILISNAYGSYLTRSAHKEYLSSFSSSDAGLIDNETLQKIVIDKNPDEVAAANSITQYGPQIEKPYRFNKFSSAAVLALLCAAVWYSENPMVIAAVSSGLTNKFNMMRRMHNLKTGQWAVVDMPSPEELAEILVEPD